MYCLYDGLQRLKSQNHNLFTKQKATTPDKTMGTNGRLTSKVEGAKLWGSPSENVVLVISTLIEGGGGGRLGFFRRESRIFLCAVAGANM